MNAVGIESESLPASHTDEPIRSPPHEGEPVTLRVAIDVGPLYGARTGIGNAVDWTVANLRAFDEIELRPYVTSMRARLRRPVRRLPVPAALAHRWWAHRSPPMDAALGHPDLVHGTNYVVPPANCGRVVSVYDCWFLEHPDQADPDVRRAGAVLRRSVGEGAHVVTSSDATSRRVRELLDTDRVTTVLLGPPPPNVAPDARPAGLPELTSFVLSLGTVERRKNLPTLIAAFGRLAREVPEVTLVVAGAVGDDTDSVNRAIRRLDARTAERVVRTGAVDDSSKSWLLHHARALAYPSLDEGFGFPILEAQAAGTPVVASTAGSIPQIAGAAALLSPPLDAEALAANLFWVVTNDDMHAKLARRGRTNLGRFSWERSCGELIEVYHDVAGAAR
jgi:glycosyltransferase involved in cell wall biosynthesis